MGNRALTFSLTIVLYGTNWLSPVAVQDACAQSDGGAPEEKWTQEIWKGIPGRNLFDLKGEEDFYRAANLTRKVGADIPRWKNQYGSRVRGMLVVPASGLYTFWLSGSEESECYLSVDGSKWNRVLIASVPSAVPHQGYDMFPHQQSEPVALVAGQEVFVELLHKDHRSRDHLTLAWSYGEGVVDWAQAPGALASQSKTWKGRASRAIDGNTDPSWAAGSVSRTSNKSGSWWQVDLGVERTLDWLTLWNSANFPNRLSNFRLVVEDDSGAEVYSHSFFEDEGYVRGRLHHELGGVQGRVVRVESLGPGRKGDQVISLAEVQVWGRDDAATVFQGREVIPDAHLLAYPGDPSDVDADELLDTWEAEHGFDVTKAQAGEFNGLGDPDFDGWNNVEESAMGTDPDVPESYSGNLSFEQWKGMPYYSTEELVQDSRFYGEADLRRRVEGSSTGELPGIYHATRLRGYLVAPATGDYRFWLSSKNSANFYLSSVSGSKYHKRLIAQLSPTIGTVSGVNYYVAAKWDQYSSQMSEPIQLEEGDIYYLEVIHQKGHAGGGHVSLAWAVPGQEREAIPAESLSTYYRLAEDADDDCLPDAWEATYGLDVNDNGRLDLERQGERGDCDADGLTNLEEYIAGTDPTSSDSDGDSLSDADELTFYGTDPTVSNDLSTEVVSELDLLSYANSSEEWSWLDGGLLAEGFRGTFDWQFSVPSDGWWMLEIAGRLRGKLRGDEVLPIHVSIDGKSQATASMRFLYGETSSLKIATPYLTAGNHQLSVLLDNYIGRRTLQITAVRVIRPGGLDSDGDGFSDWMEDRVRSANEIYPFPGFSFTSPAFIEGRSRYSGDVNASASSGSLSIEAGLSGQHWFANVPLQATGVTPFSVSFEASQLQDSGQLEWRAWNASEDAPLMLRRGDTLKFGAWNSGGTQQAATVDIGGSSYVLDAGATGRHLFAATGSYNVTATLADGTARGTTLTVYAADFGETQPFFADKPVWREYPNVPTDLWVDSSPHLWITAREVSGSGQKLYLIAHEPGPLPVAARLAESGSIVEMGEIDTIGFSDTLRNDAAVFVGSTADGYRVLRTPIVVTNLPPGGSMVVTIFKAGVTFLDGTRTLTLLEGDFEDGVVYIDFRYPENMRGGYCHYVDIYDADGNHLGRH